MTRLRLQLKTYVLASPSLSLRMPDLPCLQDLDFGRRYLIESLLLHGVITEPEVSQTVSSVYKYPADQGLRILDGLFRWTRGSSIDRDLAGKRISITNNRAV